MIKVKIILHVGAGLEQEVFAHCGAIVQGRLQYEVDETFRRLTRDYRHGAALHVSMDLGTLRRVAWKTELPSRVLSALRMRAFVVRHVDNPLGMRVKRDIEGSADGRNGLSGFAHFLARGHFTGTPPWRDRSAADWLATQLAHHEDTVSQALSGLVDDATAYARLQRVVGASMASRARHVCHGGASLAWLSAELAGTPLYGAAPWRGQSPIDWFDAQLRQPAPALVNLLRAVREDPSRKMRLMRLLGVDAKRMSRMLDEAQRVASRTAPTKSGARGDARVNLGRHTGESIDLHNAGLVCLWPLIPGLLARIEAAPVAPSDMSGDLDEQRIVSPGGPHGIKAAPDIAAETMAQKRQSATMALDYLVWGDPQWQEWRMPLNKVLCGLPLDTAIDGPALAPWRLEEIDAWLAALPGRLPGLHNCGAGELRAFFLQRPGRLLADGDRWCIEVDDDASDVLLDGLPWPVQQAVLPWLPDPIPVKWR